MSFHQFHDYSFHVNPVVLQLASGNAFFIGMGLTVLAFVLRLWLSGKIWLSVLTVAWLVGVCLVFLSATPMSWWLYGLWLVFCAGVQVAFAVRIGFPSRMSAVLAFACLSLSLCLTEIPYRLVQPVTVFTNQPVFVVGDSLSAGISRQERAWPSVLGDLSHLRVVDLAQPGATIETALNQASRITATNAVVIVEIGGNDLLGHTNRRTFYHQLDTLLGRLHTGNRHLIMFELPLLPFWNGFGEAQRDLAEKYHGTLIPKRYLAEVLGSPGATLDGLHLSQRGHNQLAKIVFGMLRIERPIDDLISGK